MFGLISTIIYWVVISVGTIILAWWLIHKVRGKEGKGLLRGWIGRYRLRKIQRKTYDNEEEAKK